MVKVLAPALSLEASGSLGGALVFSTWKGRPYVRTLVKPTNPKSEMQVGIRAMMKYLGQHWASIKTADEHYWEDLAENANISTFNAYIKENMSQWRNGLPPSSIYPAPRVQSPTAIASLGTAPGPRNVALTYQLTAEEEQQGIVLCRSLTTGFTPSWANAILVQFCDDELAHTFVDAPLAPNTYFYRCAAFTLDGLLGTFITEVQETVV